MASSTSYNRATFDAAADWLSTSPAAVSLPNDVKLEIYGIYKVLTAGPEPEGSAPGFFDFAGRAKYNAWSSQGKKYTGDDDDLAARTRYIDIAAGIGFDPRSAVDEDGQSKGGMGGKKISVLKASKHDEAMGDHPLHDAAAKGNVDDCGSLLRKHPELIDSKDDFGMTPLHIAADRGHKELVELLLAFGAKKDIKDDDGVTAKENAEGAEHWEIADML